VHPTAANIVRLSKTQRDELCRAARIPPEKRDRFIRGIEKCVAAYFRWKDQKPAIDVEQELEQIKRRVRRCLRLEDHKAWRPGQFSKDLKAISLGLSRLSAPAREYLQDRNARLVHVIPEGWQWGMPSNVVINPVRFASFDDQFNALQDLLGALAGPVANPKGRGRQYKYLERALYHCLAVAFTRDTEKAASDSSPQFMAVCEVIGRIYQLKNWNPESQARLARLLRADQDQEE
jgi:hypothetical protein